MEISQEDIFLQTIIEVLRVKGENELADLLKFCKLEFDKTNDFTKKSWQFKEYIVIKSPIRSMQELERQSRTIYEAAALVYTESENYDLYGVKIGALPVGVSTISPVFKEPEIIVKEQVYENLLSKVYKADKINPIEKMYLSEACECAKNDCRLAAATMLGCAAEILLIKLSEAFYGYLQNNGATTVELQNYERKVLQASKASNRLTELVKYISPHKKVLESLGLENPERTIVNYFDPIRLIRNDSGHPTGKVISPEDLNSEFIHYQLLMNYIHPLLDSLPNYKQ